MIDYRSDLKGLALCMVIVSAILFALPFIVLTLGGDQ